MQYLVVNNFNFIYKSFVYYHNYIIKGYLNHPAKPPLFPARSPEKIALHGLTYLSIKKTLIT
jgi:hypothetical protein